MYLPLISLLYDVPVIIKMKMLCVPGCMKKKVRYLVTCKILKFFSFLIFFLPTLAFAYSEVGKNIMQF